MGNTWRRKYEILSEASGLDLGPEVAVRRRDDARVDRYLARFADRPDVPRFERSQELRLELDRQLRHLVEKECPALRLAEEP